MRIPVLLGNPREEEHSGGDGGTSRRCRTRVVGGSGRLQERVGGGSRGGVLGNGNLLGLLRRGKGRVARCRRSQYCGRASRLLLLRLLLLLLLLLLHVLRGEGW